MRAFWMLPALVVPALAQGHSFLPRLSPHATVSQMVGTTEVTISYDRPAVRNRRIWGDLVPYGKVWRSGANAATTIRFSSSVRINGQRLAAGTYALFTLPGPEQWEVIFSRQPQQWGAYEYSQKDDVLRVQARPRPVPMTEWLTYEVTPTSLSSAYVDLLWEKVRVSFLVDVDVAQAVAQNIRRALAKAGPRDWKIWSDVANYHLEQDLELTAALGYIDRSIQIQRNPANLFVRAQILRALGRPSEAMQDLQQADQLATAQRAPGSVHGPIQATLERWRRFGNGGGSGTPRR